MKEEEKKDRNAVPEKRKPCGGLCHNNQRGKYPPFEQEGRGKIG